MTECESPLGVPEKQGAFAEDGIGYITHIPHALHNPVGKRGGYAAKTGDNFCEEKQKQVLTIHEMAVMLFVGTGIDLFQISHQCHPPPVADTPERRGHAEHRHPQNGEVTASEGHVALSAKAGQGRDVPPEAGSLPDDLSVAQVLRENDNAR